MPRGGNHNATGKNQFAAVASADDPILREALQRYHREGYTNNRTISELLLADFGIKCSESTVKRRRWSLGLFGSGKATKEIPESVKRQMVIDALGDDPKQHRGPRTIKQDIAQRTGVHLTRDFIQAVMHEVAPEGFQLRKPSAKSGGSTKKPPGVSSTQEVPEPQIQVTSAGPNERWCADHHNKLSKIGMEIFGIRDKSSGKWLGLWAVPNTHANFALAYLYLCVVEAYGGIPMHTTTECAPGTPDGVEFAEALRELLLTGSESEEAVEVEEMAEHEIVSRFLRRVNELKIDKGWFGFSVGWGDNIVTFFDSGIARGVYNAEDQTHYMLAQYLWSTFLRGELSQIRDQMNSGRILKRSSNRDPRTVGSTPNAVFTLPTKYGMSDCLQRLGPPMPAPVAALVPIPSPAPAPVPAAESPDAHTNSNGADGADADEQEEQLISRSLLQEGDHSHHHHHHYRERGSASGNGNIIMNATRRLHLAKAALGGDALLDFAPPEYARRAEEAFRDLGIPGLTYHNIWDVLGLMLPVLTANGQTQTQTQTAEHMHEMAGPSTSGTTASAHM